MQNSNETGERTQRKKTPCVRTASSDQTSEDQQEKPTQNSHDHTTLRSNEAKRFAPRRLNKKNCDCTKLSRDQTPNKTTRKIQKQTTPIRGICEHLPRGVSHDGSNAITKTKDNKIIIIQDRQEKLNTKLRIRLC